MLTNELITKQDLLSFKDELIEDIRKVLSSNDSLEPQKWLKSHDVRKLLQISPGTLQKLRINGTLTYTRIGNTMYYERDKILKLMKGGNF
jgi:hypothetical protein